MHPDIPGWGSSPAGPSGLRLRIVRGPLATCEVKGSKSPLTGSRSPSSSMRSSSSDCSAWKAITSAACSAAVRCFRPLVSSPSPSLACATKEDMGLSHQLLNASELFAISEDKLSKVCVGGCPSRLLSIRHCALKHNKEMQSIHVVTTAAIPQC